MWKEEQKGGAKVEEGSEGGRKKAMKEGTKG